MQCDIPTRVSGLWHPEVREVALIRDAATVADQIKRVEDIGVTDLCGFTFLGRDAASAHTMEFLGSMSVRPRHAGDPTDKLCFATACDATV